VVVLSTESPLVDTRHLYQERGDRDESEPGDEPEREVGAWQEQLDVSFFADSSMTLPGKGEPGKNCGDWYPAEFCKVCGEPQFGESRCEQRSCPSCWAKWSRNRTEGATRRLAVARYVASEGLSKRLVHSVVSPPEGSVRSLVDVYQGFRKAYEIGQSKGVRGGVAIFHGYRVTEEAQAAYEAEVEVGKWDPETQGKLWSWVRQHTQSWRSLTYWSPHWHLIGLCEDFEADDPDGQDGWVARRIRGLERFTLRDLEGYDDMIGCVRYLLSHATFESDSTRDCIRWFGSLATSKFSPEDEVSEGVLSVIERKIEECLESGCEASEGHSEPDVDECDNCEAVDSFASIWKAGTWLADPEWCNEIGREQQRRLSAAFEWVIGEVVPPPGLRHPRSESEAYEVLEQLV